MKQAELMETLNQLPADKQDEVLDFARFLVQQAHQADAAPKILADSAFAQWINQPLGVPGFQPLSREDANAR